MPIRTATPSMMNQARKLRQDPTEAEEILWTQLRRHRLLGIHFRRQYAIGKYIVDFCSVRRKIIIEVDGHAHLGNHEIDSDRTKYLENLGYRVLRFWNSEITDHLEIVLNTLREVINRS